MEQIVQRSDLDRLVAAGGDLLIDVADAGVPESVRFSQAVETLARRYPGVGFARIDLAAGRDVASLLGIDRAPSLVLFRSGVGLFAGPADFPEAQLEAMLMRALALDMDEVRREMDRSRSASVSVSGSRACPMTKRGEFP